MGTPGFLLVSLASSMSIACSGMARIGSNESAGAGGEFGLTALGSDDGDGEREGDAGGSSKTDPAAGGAGTSDESVAGGSSEADPSATGGGTFEQDPIWPSETGGSPESTEDGSGGQAGDGFAVPSPDGPSIDFQVLDGGRVVSGSWSGYASTYAHEALNVTPTGVEDQPAGEPLCFSGTLEATPYYTSVALLGITLNQSAWAEEPSSWTPSGSGIGYQLENPGGSMLRIELYSENFWYTEPHWCTVLDGGSGVLSWGDFNTQCWDNSGLTYDGNTPIDAISVLVPGDKTEEVKFDFCLTSIAPLGESDDATLPPDDTTGDDTTGDDTTGDDTTGDDTTGDDTTGDDTTEPTEGGSSAPVDPYCEEHPGEATGTLVEGFDVETDGYVIAGDTRGWAWLAVSSPLWPKDPIDDSHICPYGFYDVQEAGTPLCAHGIIRASDPRGQAFLGVNLNQLTAEDANAGLWVPQGSGLRYNVANVEQAPLRLSLLAEDNTAWCAPIEEPAGIIPWASFRTDCEDDTGEDFDPATPISAWMITVDGDTETDVPFDFCANGIFAE